MAADKKVRTIQLPVDVHDDLRYLADVEAQKLHLDTMSKVSYLRRLIAREKSKTA